MDRSIFQIFRLFFPRKVRLLIIISEEMLFQKHNIPIFRTWATSRDVNMTCHTKKKTVSQAGKAEQMLQSEQILNFDIKD